MKRISKQEAAEKYGVIVTGVNSLYDYYLTDDGRVIDSGGDVRYLPPNKYQKGKANARAAAIDWQHDSDNHNYTYGEMFAFQEHFTRLARRYGLIREFKENAII